MPLWVLQSHEQRAFAAAQPERLHCRSHVRVADVLRGCHPAYGALRHMAVVAPAGPHYDVPQNSTEEGGPPMNDLSTDSALSDLSDDSLADLASAPRAGL
ncbi:hypothetical protein [Deinococcus sonorensis]|uniref:Uncharacterized protein n=2 Tax=Deinococcus sonorensis TaxID=309891 RepID=A0AAU7UG65_9DEIO